MSIPGLTNLLNAALGRSDATNPQSAKPKASHPTTTDGFSKAAVAEALGAATAAGASYPASVGNPPNPPAKLTTTEQNYVSQGYLPKNYALLKANPDWAVVLAKAQSGTTGPFGAGFGEPMAMFQSAQSLDKAGLLPLVQTLQPGDILLIDANNPNEMVPKAQGGVPFDHALICVAKGPPAQFVEALEKVTYSDLSSYGNTNSGQSPTANSFRVLRPTQGMPPADAQNAVQAAIAYAKLQVGKNYDYTFLDQPASGTPNTFFCSELAADAYTQGAGIPIPLNKSPSRDAIIVTYHDLLSTLKVPNAESVAQNVYADMKAGGDLGQIITQDLIPASPTFKDVLNDPRYNQQKLAQTLDDCISGKAFQGFSKAQAEYAKMQAAGGFNDVKGPGGITIPGSGFIKEKAEQAKVAQAFAGDMKNVISGSGLPIEAAGPIKDLIGTILPHLEPLANLAFGPNSDQRKKATGFLDFMDQMRTWPAIGGIVQGLNLPQRAPPTILQTFPGPTDEGWSGMAWQDFGQGINPEQPLSGDPMLNPDNPTAGYTDLLHAPLGGQPVASSGEFDAQPNLKRDLH